MDNKKIQSMMQNALETEVPSADIDLWPAVKSLVAGKQSFYQQEDLKMNTFPTRRVPRAALAILAVIALCILALATPQGRTFAQNVLGLFTQTEETSFPLSDSQIAVEPEQDSATAQPPSPLITVAEAEAQAGFHVAELSLAPEGFTYLGARLYGNTIHIEYQTTDLNGHLNIIQSEEGYYESDWDSVPTEFVIPVKIGELDGEFVQGTFVVFPTATSATWNPDAPILRLRWEKDGIYYEIAKYGDGQAIEYLDQVGLVALAEDLMGH